MSKKTDIAAGQKRKPGRQQKYVPSDYYGEICEWIASGKTLRDYCRQEGKPSRAERYGIKTREPKQYGQEWPD